MSAAAIAPMSVVASQPISSIPRGSNAGGPTRLTCAPTRANAWISDRATRECRTSPTIATCSPSSRPSSSRIVYRSSSACVGCWCLPSPAFTMCAPVARGGQVLADVVGPDRELAVPAVDEHGELNSLRAAIVEQRLDRGADRATGVEHVVDQDDRLALEREVERSRAYDRLRMARRISPAHLDVVAVEGDVDGAEDRPRACALLDESPEALRERNAARLDADEGDTGEVGIPLDDLVRDARERAAERFRVHQDRVRGGRRRQLHSTPFRPHWTGLKGFGRAGLYSVRRTAPSRPEIRAGGAALIGGRTHAGGDA